MATSTESLRLLHEYASLKRLIESHKRSNGGNLAGNYRYRAAKPNPGPEFGQPHALRKRSTNIYSLKRTTATTLTEKPPILRNETCSKAPLMVNGARNEPSKCGPAMKCSKFGPFNTKMIVSKYKMTKYSNVTAQFSLKPKLTAPTAAKSQYSWSASCSERQLGAPPSHSIESRTRYSPLLSLKSNMRSSPSLASTKQRSNQKVTPRIRSNATPKSIRRVNKYSLKNTTTSTPSKSFSGLKTKRQKANLANTSTYTSKGRQSLNTSKSHFVVIGKLLYKTSKTKLSRTGSAKTKSPIRSAELRKTNVKSSKERLVTVRGVRFSMDSQGKTLRRVDPVADLKGVTRRTVTSHGRGFESDSLSRVDIGGETYIRTRPGVLIRSPGNQLRSLASRVVTKSIHQLTLAKQSKSQQFCLFFNKFGRCSKQQKGNCPFIHDADKIAVCKRFLRCGECNVKGCAFSHQICSLKMPVCTFFMHGRCSSDFCPYRHVNVNPEADLCIDFTNGYCPLGEKCKKWHVTVCAEYERNGQCEKGDKCPLTHRDKPRAMNGKRKEGTLAKSLGRKAVKPSLDRWSTSDDDEEANSLRLPSFISLSSFESPLPTNKKRDENISSDERLQIKPGFMSQVTKG